MNINKRVIEQLEQLAHRGPEQVEALLLDSSQQEAYIVGVADEAEGLGVVVNLQDFDRYSAAVRTLEVSYKDFSPSGGETTEAYLRQAARHLVERLTYFEEPLTLLELDAGAEMALLRSDPPRQADEEVTYWEALIQFQSRPKVSLSRYRWAPGQREREAVVYPATFSTLGRLAEDLASSLAAAAK